MEKALPPKLSAESKGLKENPDPMLFVEFEGEDGPEFVPFTILHAEAANRQADLMEAAIPLLERIAVALEKKFDLETKKASQLDEFLGRNVAPDFASDGAEIFEGKS